MTAKLVKQVCFLLSVGCRDNVNMEETEFVQFVHDFRVVDKLKKMAESDHEDLRLPDVRELLVFTIDRCEEALEALLGIAR